MKYSVCVSNAAELKDIAELGNDMLQYKDRTWDQVTELVQQSAEQGFICIIRPEEPGGGQSG